MSESNIVIALLVSVVVGVVVVSSYLSWKDSQISNAKQLVFEKTRSLSDQMLFMHMVESKPFFQRATFARNLSMRSVRGLCLTFLEYKQDLLITFKNKYYDEGYTKKSAEDCAIMDLQRMYKKYLENLQKGNK